MVTRERYKQLESTSLGNGQILLLGNELWV